jgi:hypothetical protein
LRSDFFFSASSLAHAILGDEFNEGPTMLEPLQNRGGTPTGSIYTREGGDTEDFSAEVAQKLPVDSGLKEKPIIASEIKFIKDHLVAQGFSPGAAGVEAVTNAFQNAKSEGLNPIEIEILTPMAEKELAVAASELQSGNLTPEKRGLLVESLSRFAKSIGPDLTMMDGVPVGRSYLSTTSMFLSNPLLPVLGVGTPSQVLDKLQQTAETLAARAQNVVRP